ncbi:MAG TPA: hypothetical protein GYA08_14670 [Chloroflexi bacterium]|nr:hypothetical protein [Chloroflexota bacterium]
MMNTYIVLSAWREALARIFDGFTAQDNVSPDWLVNPSTNRKLKLDKAYPEVNIAVRFIGLTARGQGRQSDLEVLENEERERARAELCRAHGVHLASIDPAEDCVKQMDGLLSVLARASRSMANSDRPAPEKAALMTALATARSRAEQLRSRLAHNPEQMLENLAAGWRDREANLAVELSAPAPAPGQAVAVVLTTGQRVRHTRFGEGVVTRIDGSGPEAMVAILFDAAQERTFRADLLADKVEVL